VSASEEGLCSMELVALCLSYKIFVGNPEGKRHSGDLDMDDKVILD
jgi:hypothetical protein